MGETFFDGMRQIEAAALSSGEKFLLIVLLRFGGNSGEAWPSHETLSRSLSASQRAVRNWQRSLIRAGVLSVQSGGGRGASNRYRVNLSKLPGNPEPRSAFTEVGLIANPEPRSAFEGAIEDANPEPRSAHPGTTFLPPRNHVPTKGNRKTNERKERGARPKFVRPTLEEVKAFAAELDAERCVENFHDHFESNGWLVGGKAVMKNWKAAFRKWVRNEPTFSRSPRGAAAGPRGSAAAEKAFDTFAAALRQFGGVRMGKVREQFEESEWPVVWKAVSVAGGADAIADRPDAVRGRFVKAFDDYGKAGVK